MIQMRDVLVAEEYYQERLREAERERLARRCRSLEGRRASRWQVWLGCLFVRLGLRLQGVKVATPDISANVSGALS
jgi:hypothetical protein